MIDITDKQPTHREAVVRCTVRMSDQAIRALAAGHLPKGDALAAARIAGTIAAKRTPGLIPFCHPIPLDAVDLRFEVRMEAGEVVVEATARAHAPTGVEMEAFCAAAVAALTIYDMCKSLDPAAEITALHLVRKSGGKDGAWQRPTQDPGENP